MAFDILLENLQNQVLTASTQPLFEITKTRSPEWVSSMTGIMASTNTTYQYTSIPFNDSAISIETNANTDAIQHYYNSYDEVATDLNTSYITYTTSNDDLIDYSSERTISCGDTEGFSLVFKLNVNS